MHILQRQYKLISDCTVKSIIFFLKIERKCLHFERKTSLHLLAWINVDWIMKSKWSKFNLRPFTLQVHLSIWSYRTRNYRRMSFSLFSLFLHSLLISILMSHCSLRLPLLHQISRGPENQNLCLWHLLQMDLLPVKLEEKRNNFKYSLKKLKPYFLFQHATNVVTFMYLS